MNKHDYLVDNVNSKSPVERDHEVRSTQKCSYQQDESTENCSFQQCGACGGNNSVAESLRQKCRKSCQFDILKRIINNTENEDRH